MSKKVKALQQFTSNVTKTSVSGYVKDSMKVYGSYVIGERAVCDVRDGLKPVQRRILWAMNELGAVQAKAHRKSAKIVGDTMGNFHPHGNLAIYDTLVNMVHARYPLIEGHGNFGSDLDPPAADRYTEARLTKLGESTLEDSEVVKFVPNYSGDKKEPLYLPARVPLVLANGSSGIAVGISACIPPHNLGELISTTIALVRRPKMKVRHLMKFVKGPDHGTGILISTDKEIRQVYATGRGTLQYRCEYELGKDKANSNIFILKSTAPGFNLGTFLQTCGKLQNDGLIEYVTDQSDSRGIKVLIAYKDARVLKDRIISAIHSSESYQFYTVARDGGDTLSSETLKFCTFRDLLTEFVKFRRHIETRRTKRLRKIARRELKKQRALLCGILNLATVFKVLKVKHADRKALTAAMAKALGLDEEGADFILETKTYQLSRMQVDDVRKQINAIRVEIKGYNNDLADIDKVVVRRLEDMKKFADDRQTKIRTEAAQVAGGSSKGYVVARSNGIIQKMGNKVPSSTQRTVYDHIVKVDDRTIAVSSNNTGQNFWLAYATEDKFKPIVCLSKDSDLFVSCLDESGRGVNFNGDIEKDEFQIFKKVTGKIVSATGVGKKDKLVCLAKNDQGYIVNPKDCKVTRPNVLAYQVVPGFKGTVIQVMRLPEDAVLVQDGAKIKLNKDETKFNFDHKSLVYVVGKRNYAVVKRQKGVYDQKTVLDALADGKCTHSICLD